MTAVAKAHQADIGNSIPTTYHAAARDVYEEGSLIFPAVRIQRGYEMIDDIVRMCRSRIRVRPDVSRLRGNRRDEAPNRVHGHAAGARQRWGW